MAPATRFTKIWKLKNVGEVAWPAGARLLFVGGDAMSADPSVPLPTSAAVAPGEEVDVAADMVAPTHLGRYVGYWRLAGPAGRRRFGQRVWCAVQVVNLDAPPMPPTEAEISAMMASTPRGEATDDDGMPSAEIAAAEETPEEPPVDAMEVDKEVDKSAARGKEVDKEAEAAEVHVDTAQKVKEPEKLAAEPGELVSNAAAAPRVEDDTLDNDTTHVDGAQDKVMADAGLCDAEHQSTSVEIETNVDGAAGGVPRTAEAIEEELTAMGFSDKSLVRSVVEAHGGDLEACVHELASLAEWDAMLDDLDEMGFGDRSLNQKLLAENHGSIKKTVKSLISEAGASRSPSRD